MKLENITFLALIWIGAFHPVAQAQDNRTQNTRVADVLALLTANDNKDAERLFRQLIALNEEGLAMITARVMPNGEEEGVAPRYAVSLLTHHASTKQEKARIEKAYLLALEKAPDTEVKAYFIDNLKIIGSNASVKSLSEIIPEQGLAQQAISALVSIQTNEAREALLSSLQTGNVAHAEARLIQALGELKHQPAVQTVAKFVTEGNDLSKKHALWSLALIADASSYGVLLQQAKNVSFKNDPS